MRRTLIRSRSEGKNGSRTGPADQLRSDPSGGCHATGRGGQGGGAGSAGGTQEAQRSEARQPDQVVETPWP